MNFSPRLLTIFTAGNIIVSVLNVSTLTFFTEGFALNEKKLATHELVRHFKQTDKLHRCLIEQRMKELNLHRSQHIMLMCIAGFDGDAPLTQKMLSQKLDISAATVI